MRGHEGFWMIDVGTGTATARRGRWAPHGFTMDPEGVPLAPDEPLRR
jgi:hypothetical protein